MNKREEDRIDYIKINPINFFKKMQNNQYKNKNKKIRVPCDIYVNTATN